MTPNFSFQDKAVELTLQALGKNKSVLLQAPTGAGKTKMATEIAKHLPKPILFLAERIEIINQSIGAFQRAGITVNIVTADVQTYGRRREFDFCDVTIAMKQTLWSRAVNAGHSFPKFKSLVIDECFVAGTPILMGDGTELPIEAVKAGDLVMSAFGPCVVASCTLLWTHSIIDMRLKNPMYNSDIREKMSQKLKKMGHGPKVRGGNGRGLTTAQGALLNWLGDSWKAEYVVCTKMGRYNGYPTHYKIDIANPDKMIAIEVDGFSHSARARQLQDAKKDRFLRDSGWRVLRLKNARALSVSSTWPSRDIHLLLQEAS